MRQVSIATYTERILNHVTMATPGEIQQGVSWYAVASDTCYAIACEHNVPNAAVCAIMAALSPRKRWGDNVSLCNRVCAMLKCGEDVRTTNLHTQDNLKKVHDIWNARHMGFEHLRDLLGKKAPKVKAFYFGLFFGGENSKHMLRRYGMFDECSEAAMEALADTVALDRHAIRVCDPSLGDVVPPPKVHLDMRMAYVEAALQLGGIDESLAGLAPYQVQAIAWVVTRGSAQ